MTQKGTPQLSFTTENIYAVVLCGGSGTRLWPLSRRAFPKQFLSLGGADTSLLQATLARLKNIAPVSKRWLVTARGQEQLTAKQTKDIASHIVVEPAARNTGPAIALAASELLKKDPGAVMVIVSSDHVVQNVSAFEETIARAVQLAKQDYFVTVGIQPTYPATGFGYIERGDGLDANGHSVAYNTQNFENITIGSKVQSFREKPDQATAEQFLKTGRYLWNAGIFVWKVETFWKAFAKLQPNVASFFEKATARDIDEKYVSLEAIPIDISFMEKAKNVACVPSLFDWNDVGSWAAVRECFAQDKQGNSVSGDVFLSDTKNSVLHSDGIFVSALGLEDMCVVATRDAVLVMPLSKSQEIKKVITTLESQKRNELL